MKLAGATTAAAAMFATGSSADEDDYEVIEASGQTINVDNETFENKLIDVSNGNAITVSVGDDATIRNVGVSGLYQGDGFIFSIGGGGEVEFDNVYLGDGANKTGGDHAHGPGAVFYHRNASADVTFRRMNVQGYPNNGFYCSNSANGGAITWIDCYGKNNGVSTFRAASGEDSLHNCVAYNDDTDYSTDYGSWGGYTEDSGRPLWVHSPGGVVAEDCHFAAGSYPSAVLTHDGANATLDGGAISGGTSGAVDTSSAGSDPDLSVPDGVPTSPEEAVSGNEHGGSGSGDDEAVGNGDDEELPNALVFDGNETTNATRYEFEVAGDVEPSSGEDADIDGSLVHGVVADWSEPFRFDGDLEQLTLDGPATVSLDGDEIDPDDYGEEYPHTLEVEGEGEPTSFEVTVDGSIDLESSAAEDDETTTVSGSTVQSSVTDDTVTVEFSGALTDVTIIDGDATVRLDDDVIDSDDYGDHKLLPHALVIDGTEDDDPSEYTFTASGAVVESTYQDATIDDDDVIEAQSVTGDVDGHLDAYWFDGDIEDFTLVGNATVDIQYNVREQ
ncbi:hypothetical protein SAMN05421809_3183 [Natronorubrum daqingense]|nr:hypothetical protein SAMN05421809_3183 [Natronorubrum daqingense]